VTRIHAAVSGNRKIGLGVMGFADALIDLAIPYDGDAAVRFAEAAMAFIAQHARETSRALARERGSFPNFPRSRFARDGEPPMRNATVTAIAPTGTLSLIAGCSSGIEPHFALAYERRVLDGRHLVEINARLERALDRLPGLSAQARHDAIHHGRLAGVSGVPAEVARLFRTAPEILPEQHLRIQAAFQRHVDNAVSKTINLAREASDRDVRTVFERAHELDCKGITVFREGSAPGAVLERLDAEAGACPDCGVPVGGRGRADRSARRMSPPERTVDDRRVPDFAARLQNARY
jgi:ribonucleoside-diphosphate reductase alpha chain